LGCDGERGCVADGRAHYLQICLNRERWRELCRLAAFKSVL